MDRRGPEPGTRVSIRAVTQNAPSEVIGWVLAADDEGVLVRDRRGVEHRLDWGKVTAWRSVGVPRGHDPLRTSSAALEQLAASAGLSGRRFVIRASQLLDARAPLRSSAGDGVSVEGEWALIAGTVELLPAAWWAVRSDARNLLVVTDDASRAAELIGFGFTEVLAAEHQN